MSEFNIENVSDTALWVATYRALESTRPDALFKDPLAARLAGEKGHALAKKMKGTQYTGWSVIIRTCIIDQFILQLIKEGVDTILNLGAGLDTRPYRMEVPASLKWIEVDFPHLIQAKEARLQDEKPRCQLERVSLDLSDRETRGQLFSRIAGQSERVLVLTEGVIPYLKNEDVATLADDLAGQPKFRHWILDYFAPEVVKYMQSKKRLKQMKNAPIQFAPKDWYGFFEEHGWKAREIKYLADVSEKLGRKIPIPWFAIIFALFVPRKKRELYRKFTGYVLLEPK